MSIDDVWGLVLAERVRQADKWGRAHEWGWGDCSSHRVPLAVKLAVLSEEVGEANRAFLERDHVGLRAELVQVAAVAVAMLEGLEAADC